MSLEQTALVLAGGSFVGRHLCRRLRARRLAVVGTGRGEDMGYCDIGDRQSVRELFIRVDAAYVFVCAAATAPAAAAEEMYRVHVTGTLNVLRAAVDYLPDAVLVFLGSAAEYGVVAPEYLPVSEDHPIQPASLFGASKAAQSQLALTAAVDWNLRVLVARPFNLLGPGLPEHYLAAALAARLRREGATGQPLAIRNADATRDFVDVRDAAEALAALIEKAVPRPGCPRVFNIAAQQETSVLDVARFLCELHGGRSALPVGSAGSRSGIWRSCGDATRLRQATGWRPAIDWRQSVRDMWEQASDPALWHDLPIVPQR
jgi:nucleoside-diphosphate-sugar epimerase